MSETNNDILKQLQSYQVEPPDTLFSKVWEVVSKDEQTLSEINAEENKNKSLINSQNGNASDILRNLQHYELEAPPFDYNAITGSAHKENQASIVSLSQKKKISFIYKVAAAVVVISLASWSVYTLLQKKNTDKIAAVNIQDKDVAGNGSLTQKKSTQDINVATSSLNKNTQADTYIKSIRTKNNLPVLDTDAQLVNAEGNELFVTLINYNYEEASVFLDNRTKTQRVKLDQYSYVTVSDKMAAMLKQTYAVKKNKKPTWKAKRSKAMLRKWKKQDEKNFDKDTNQNPLDIIDLSEFILK